MRGFDQSPRLCVSPYSLTWRKMRKCAFRYFRGSDTGSRAQLLTWFDDFQFIEKSNFRNYQWFEKYLNDIRRLRVFLAGHIVAMVTYCADTRPGFDSWRGNCMIFWIISFCLLRGFDQSPRLCASPYSLTWRKMRKCAFRYFRGSDTGLRALAQLLTWFDDFQFIEKSNFRNYQLFEKYLNNFKHNSLHLNLTIC